MGRLHVLWNAKGDVVRTIGARPTVVDPSEGLAYGPSADQTQFIATEIETGHVRWRAALSIRPTDRIHDILLPIDLVVVRTALRVEALSRLDGTRRWKIDVTTDYGLHEDEDSLYLVHRYDSGSVKALDVATGRVLWNRNILIDSERTVVETIGHGEAVIRTAAGRRRVLFDPDTGEPSEPKPTDGARIVTRFEDDAYRQVADPGSTGRETVTYLEKWRVGAKAPTWRVATAADGDRYSVSGDAIYFVSGRGVHAISVDDGQERWCASPGSRDYRVSDAVIWAIHDDLLVAIDPRNGKLRGTSEKYVRLQSASVTVSNSGDVVFAHGGHAERRKPWSWRLARIAPSGRARWNHAVTKPERFFDYFDGFSIDETSAGFVVSGQYTVLE